jgi:HD-like signal output (HDOD) protein
MQGVASAVRYCGERFDATENLCGEQIPLFASIVAVAHAYDRMTEVITEGGVYERLTHEAALEKLQTGAGKQFDPNVVATFCKLKSIGQIRDAVNGPIIGMSLLPGLVPEETNNLSTADLLNKFKTEPMLAFDALRLANQAGEGEPTARLLPAMTRLGEERLRQLVRQYGLPATNEKTNASITRALRRANAAQLLAAHNSSIIHPDDAYSLGLLHDIGETLLLKLFPNEMLGLEKFDEKTRRRRQIEVFAIDYAQISRWMLEAACGLPQSLTAAISTHQEEIRLNTPISILMYLADRIAKTGESDRFASVEAIGAEVLTALHLNRANLRAIYDRAISITEEQINARQEVCVLA